MRTWRLQRNALAKNSWTAHLRTNRWNQHLKTKHYGDALWDVALLKQRNLLLEYVGDDDEKVMQYIADNLDLDIPNQFMINDLSEVVDQWVQKKFTAAEARSELLRIFSDYLDGC